MKALSGKEFCRILKKQGWQLERINGSHYTYSKKGNSQIITVPVHKNQSLGFGLQKKLMKKANIGIFYMCFGIIKDFLMNVSS